eukprot:CAMPEP_0198207522 /NCGR_PEP_ID=MMETSP1445-20131203/10956_1 /TAXON_ID=36898 /ORGANISM="Pyramimonas sp., Strain CCMP2087" /LENGTH=139 /DNA_ID=CAMNT_0043880579 /DNA_START=432 /DNA_END=851 /DNA_ORIENTATION=-
MSWYGLAVRSAGKIAFGVMAGMELKDIVKQFDYSDRVMASEATEGREGTTMLLTIGAKDPNFWVQVGRMLGITLALVEVGRLMSSFLVSREMKLSVKHFHIVRENAYSRVENRNLKKGVSESAAQLRKARSAACVVGRK